MPPDEQELIFQKFVRGSGAKRQAVAGLRDRTRHLPHAGAAHGRDVGVESPPPSLDSGASFHLWLPLRRARRAGCARPTATAAPAPEGAAALIVDDEEYNRTVIAGLARELGYRPLQASDASSARLRHEGAIRPMSCSSTFSSPGSKGSETAKILRNLPGGAQAILIASTAHDSDEVRRQCREAGMDGFLLKPFDKEQVRRLVAQVHGAGRRMEGVGESQARPIPKAAAESAAVARPRTLRARRAGIAGRGRAAFPRRPRRRTRRRRGGIAADDRKAIQAAGHRLRTLAALVHADRLAEIAVRLQDRAHALGPADLASLLDEAAREASGIRTDLGPENAAGRA